MDTMVNTHPHILVTTNGDIDIIQKIAAAGGFPDLPDIEGLTPLHLASSKGHHVVCATLYRLGAPINPLDLHMQVLNKLLGYFQRINFATETHTIRLCHGKESYQMCSVPP